MLDKTRKTIKEHNYKNNFRLTRALVDSARQAKEGVEDPQPPGASERVPEHRFRARYANIRRSAQLHLCMMGLLAVTTGAAAISGAVMYTAMGAATLGLVGILYVKTSFRMWVARGMLKEWPHYRREVVGIHHYWEALADDWTEVCPKVAPDSLRALGRSAPAGPALGHDQRPMIENG